jgi:hypothetical protein
METKILRLGDEGAAILTIQSTQSDPQKAIAELIENSIDAKSKTINIIRHRYNGEVEILIKDDGEGVKPGLDGSPDMDRIPTEICKSFKKQLDEHLKEGIQGEFAIGLLGFAAIGDNLEMISRTNESPKTKFLKLKANSLNYDSGIYKDRLDVCGTIIHISPVHENIQQRLTAEKLNKYLGEELRERIRQSQVRIFIEDQIGRKVELEVKPQDFKGDKISQISKVKTVSGNIHFRLFIPQQGEKGKVSVYRHGTKIIDDITEIQELNHEPWNTNNLEGMIDSKFINVPPGTRKGIVPDKHFTEFIDAVKSQEKQLIHIIEKALEKREQEMSKDLIKSLRDSFQEIMKDLSSEYNWFDSKGEISIVKPGLPIRERESETKFKIRVSLGPLEYITITPKVSQIEPNERKKYIVRAWTLNDELIPIGVDYRWSVKPLNLCSLEAINDECYLTASADEGEVKLTVVASLHKITKQESIDILILSKSNKKVAGGFPIPKGIYMPSEKWRSRWNSSVNTLEYNTGHEDYLKAEQKGKKNLLRYMGLLYAKQLVLHNFKTSGEESVMERMIEVISRFEIRI